MQVVDVVTKAAEEQEPNHNVIDGRSNEPESVIGEQTQHEIKR